MKVAAWGGARRGAGRPKKGPIASERHQRRPELPYQCPVRITTRLERAVASLKGRAMYAAIRRGVQRTLGRTDFRIIELVVRDGRVHLVVEAHGRHALARGMQGFAVAAARALNKERGRSGRAFCDRYRPTLLRTRDQVRAAASAMIRHRIAARANDTAVQMTPVSSQFPTTDALRPP
ncbi:MAG TPA: hypothetical protein VGM90_12670 [Kofleriaceae bacterium]